MQKADDDRRVRTPLRMRPTGRGNWIGLAIALAVTTVAVYFALPRVTLRAPAMHETQQIR